MNKKDFNKITHFYGQIAERCENFTKLVSGDLDDLTIRELKTLLEEGKKLQAASDTILSSELYHLIGMGNLTAPQTSELCKLVKRISQTRSYVKPIASYQFTKLPEVPEKSDYKCKVADIKLTSIFKEEKK